MLEVIILAAGKGSRMHSNLPKVLHPLAGRPLIGHVLDTARDLGAERLHVVVGHGADLVEAEVSATDVTCHLQVAGNVCRTYLGFNQISTMAYYNV